MSNNMRKMLELQIKLSESKEQDPFRIALENLEEMVELLFPSLGLHNMDFSIESLKSLENAINDMFPIGHEPLSTTALFIGLYVGETIRREVPGLEWDFPSTKRADEVKVVGKVGDTTFEAKPVRRVVNFWFDRTDTIYGWANMIKDVKLGNLNFNNTTPFTWQERPDGTSVRVIQVHKGGKNE